MKKLRLILFSAFACLALAASAEDVNISTADTTNQTENNKQIFERISRNLQDKRDLPLSDLVVEVGLQLLETPYLWASLEIEPEQLQVFLDKTDCILFVELSTCMAITLKGKKIVQMGDGEHYNLRAEPSVVEERPSYELLLHNIQQMRYRLGKVDGYASRIHYTSEWLLQNQTNGILREYTKDLGKEFTQEFFYMSAHPKTYFQLSKDPCELGKIRLMEDRLNQQQPYYYISQKQLKQKRVISEIRNGDIITFISPRPGLDLAHVAIAYEVNGEMHFMHASYGAKKVIIEPKTLADYATNGIRISRLNDMSLSPLRLTKKDDWAQYYRYEQENDSILKTKNSPKFVFLGNSITDFWGRWRKEFFEQNNAVSRGISGQTTVEMLSRFQADVVSLRPQYVVILAGVNDIAQNMGPISIEHIMQNIKSMCQIARYNNIEPILCSPLPSNHFFWRKQMTPAADIALLVEQIKQYAEDSNIVFVDYYSQMKDTDGALLKDFTEDGCHPNLKGYQQMEQIIQPTILKL